MLILHSLAMACKQYKKCMELCGQLRQPYLSSNKAVKGGNRYRPSQPSKAQLWKAKLFWKATLLNMAIFPLSFAAKLSKAGMNILSKDYPPDNQIDIYDGSAPLAPSEVG